MSRVNPSCCVALLTTWPQFLPPNLTPTDDIHRRHQTFMLIPAIPSQITVQRARLLGPFFGRFARGPRPSTGDPRPHPRTHRPEKACVTCVKRHQITEAVEGWWRSPVAASGWPKAVSKMQFDAHEAYKIQLFVFLNSGELFLTLPDDVILGYDYIFTVLIRHKSQNSHNKVLFSW